MKTRLCLAVIGCTLLSQSAWADTRDDVVQGILRCAAIRDDRAWLNCTYGAQQPMRAKLGLPPAPDFQQRLVPPPYGARAVPAPGYVPPPAPSRAAPPPASAYAPPPGYVLKRADEVDHSPSFMQILSGTAKPVAVAAITAVSYDNGGGFTVTLQNGQKWHEVNPHSPPSRPKKGTRATVTPGAIGSYNLKTDDSPRTYKVEQVR